jgi:lipoyl(octanoyl) transferase
MTIEVKISKRLIPYKSAFIFLQKRVDDVKKGRNSELLWILEHPLTFTAGIRAKENEVLDKKIKLIKTNRGGKITLHSPGQKVIYFVLNLNNRKKDIRRLVNAIETSIISFLNIYEINAVSDKNNIGIWVKQKKIASIGIKVKSWIAYHGCSINIKNNLNYYKKIIPCGLNNKAVTSLKNQSNKKISYVNKNLKKIFLKNLINI